MVDLCSYVKKRIFRLIIKNIITKRDSRYGTKEKKRLRRSEKTALVKTGTTSPMKRKSHSRIQTTIFDLRDALNLCIKDVVSSLPFVTVLHVLALSDTEFY